MSGSKRLRDMVSPNEATVRRSSCLESMSAPAVLCSFFSVRSLLDVRTYSHGVRERFLDQLCSRALCVSLHDLTVMEARHVRRLRHDLGSQPVAPRGLPEQLLELQIGNIWERLPEDSFPSRLTRLELFKLPHWGMHPRLILWSLPDVLPASLTELALGEFFNQPLEVGLLPQG